jgi:putative holliday junction resolvase
MRLLGIDYGTKKIGLALTDEEGVMAFPHAVIPNDEKAEAYIESLVTKEEVGEIIIGHSLNREGAPNKVHEAVEALMLNLTLSIGVPIHLEPEQYTTQEAIRLQGRNDKTDASAAAIILNSYIERNTQYL